MKIFMTSLQTRLKSAAAFVLLVLLTMASQSAPAAESSSDRMAWFKEARFGMFIHWGLYAVPAGEWEGKTTYGEWFQLETKMPGAQYEKFAAQFNPVKFNAREWVRVAKNAGMKYIVITAKHHDGFCMFDTRLTDYNVVKATPWKHDPMKDLAAACKEAGITFCFFYYSDPDWHDADFPARYSQRGFHGAPNPDADLEKYVTYMKGQVRELLTGYGPIGIMWFDGGGAFKAEGEQGRAKLLHAQEIIDEIHQLQPRCLVNNRLGLPGDYGTPEQKIPGQRPTNSFEVCMTLNRHWGYNKNDQNWKEPKAVIQNLADIASKGGNYLLNVGPTAEGTFPPDSVRILNEVGLWMKVNGDSIYGTSASPLDATPSWGRATQKGSRLYLHVFDWPADGKLMVNGLSATVKQAYLLSDPKRAPLDFARVNPLDVSVNVPSVAPDKNDSVVVLECSALGGLIDAPVLPAFRKQF
jgi:alpha-L-fucosidase